MKSIQKQQRRGISAPPYFLACRTDKTQLDFRLRKTSSLPADGCEYKCGIDALLPPMYDNSGILANSTRTTVISACSEMVRNAKEMADSEEYKLGIDALAWLTERIHTLEGFSGFSAKEIPNSQISSSIPSDEECFRSFF